MLTIAADEQDGAPLGQRSLRLPPRLSVSDRNGDKYSPGCARVPFPLAIASATRY